jgi:hypothetical protein
MKILGKNLDFSFEKNYFKFEFMIILSIVLAFFVMFALHEIIALFR